MNEWSATGKVQGTWNQSSREWTVQGMNGPWRERSAGFIHSREQKFPETNGPGNECSRVWMVLRTKVPSWEQVFQGMNSLKNECSSIPLSEGPLVDVHRLGLGCVPNLKFVVSSVDPFSRPKKCPQWGCDNYWNLPKIIAITYRKLSNNYQNLPKTDKTYRNSYQKLIKSTEKLPKTLIGGGITKH